MQLTEHQVDFLQRVRNGIEQAGCVHRAQCRGPCKAGNRLVERGLLLIVSELPRTYAITDAGRAALKGGA